MRISLGTTACVVLTAAGLLAADLPYSGKWKLNVAKSDFGQTTVTYEQMTGGEVKFSADGVSYTFKADGKESPTPWGTTAAWKSLDANTWETINRANAKVVGTDTLKLSADGKSLTVNSKNMKANGESSDDTVVFQRVSGGQGLAGKWKTANLKVSSPGILEVAEKGADRLTLTYVDLKGVCDAKLDGKDYPASGPMSPSGWTCALARSGDRAFELVWKKDGKPLYKSTFSAGADAKTLTETGGAVATTEKIKAVYDRQ